MMVPRIARSLILYSRYSVLSKSIKAIEFDVSPYAVDDYKFSSQLLALNDEVKIWSSNLREVAEGFKDIFLEEHPDIRSSEDLMKCYLAYVYLTDGGITECLEMVSGVLGLYEDSNGKDLVAEAALFSKKAVSEGYVAPVIVAITEDGEIEVNEDSPPEEAYLSTVKLKLLDRGRDLIDDVIKYIDWKYSQTLLAEREKNKLALINAPSPSRMLN